MELKDSPLNMAHAEARKAERCQKAQKWGDAIKYHTAAIELLTEAQDNTSDVRAIDSVKLQQDYHRRQIALLEHRQKCQVSRSKESSMNKPSEHPHKLNLELHEGAAADKNSSERTQVAIQTIEECDSLLHMLNQRSQLTGTEPEKSTLHTGVKTPKSEATIVEELRIQNEELRFHVIKLLHENQEQSSQITQLRADNDRLREAIKLNDSGTNVDLPLSRNNSAEQQAKELDEKTAPAEPSDYHIDSEEEDNYFNMSSVENGELPPLEIPQFDFDSVKS